MVALNWLNSLRGRPPATPMMDGALVLDRLEVRLGTPLRGDARIIIAGQLEIAVARILSSQSLTTVALIAQREGERIASLLPRQFAAALLPILADELIKSHPVTSARRH
ncbi:MAG: hypothetical protein AB7L90_05500 [Hyphomicrobiaceae bacterium]